MKKAKGPRPIKQFLTESLNSEKNTDIMVIYDKYADLYYPRIARYIVALTFYIVLLLWIYRKLEI